MDRAIYELQDSTSGELLQPHADRRDANRGRQLLDLRAAVDRCAGASRPLGHGADAGPSLAERADRSGDWRSRKRGGHVQVDEAEAASLGVYEVVDERGYSGALWQ